ERDAKPRLARGLELDLQHPRELGPSALTLVERLEEAGDALALRGLADEALEGLLGVEVPGVPLEDLLVMVDGASGLLDVPLVDLPELERELDGLLAIDGEELLREERGEVAVTLALAVEPLEGVPARLVVGRELEHR